MRKRKSTNMVLRDDAPWEVRRRVHQLERERYVLCIKSLIIAGNIKSGTTANYSDDGVSQKTTIKSGVELADVIVPNPVKLRPYRTFAEIEQPESSYVFRIKDSERGPAFKLVEADGGLWKNATMKKIKEYLEYELSEELKEYHITVIA